MKANITNNKKNTTMRKIVPAAGMLSISAVMLATSTYAWFTMSREVEVTGIKMTASVPEDLQISLGKLAVTGTPATAVTEATSTANSLAGSTGVLYASTGVAGDGNAAAPENSWDWSNSADISAYYDFGRLIPASSYDGTEIFFTPDASGVGKTVKGNANYIQATNKLTAVSDEGSGTTYKTTLHALTGTRADAAADGKDAWAKATYTQAAAYNKTNDDGYYVDIPVWIRSSSNAAINLSVDGYVLPGSIKDGGSNTETDLELYRAVRVAILDGEAVTADATTGAVACAAGDAAVATGNNIIPLKDAWDTTQNVSGGVFSAITAKANPWDNSNTSILDSLNYKRATVGNASMADTDLYGVSAVSATATDPDGDGISNTHAATYSEYTAITATSAASGWSNVATIAGSTTGGEYGAAKKLVVRVWLDGEDQECWNDNAGQDWAISLKFAKIEATT